MFDVSASGVCNAVLIPLKSSPMIRSGIWVIWCSGGRYPLGTESIGGDVNVDEVYVSVEGSGFKFSSLNFQCRRSVTFSLRLFIYNVLLINNVLLIYV